MWLAANSQFKSDSDLQKYEKARKLKVHAFRRARPLPVTLRAGSACPALADTMHAHIRCAPPRPPPPALPRPWPARRPGRRVELGGL